MSERKREVRRSEEHGAIHREIPLCAELRRRKSNLEVARHLALEQRHAKPAASRPPIQRGIDSAGSQYVSNQWPQWPQRPSGQGPRPIPMPFPMPGRRPPASPPPPVPQPPQGPSGGGSGGSSSRWRGSNDDRVNVAALRDITDDSGGRTEIVRDARDLNPATASIADELSKQYYLGYPSSGKKDGRWHTIRVALRNHSYRVRARKGNVAS